MGKLLRIVLLLFTVFLLVGCTDELPELELDTPTNVVIQDGVVTWNVVANAEEYVVTVGTNTYTVTTTTFNLTTLTLAAGSYQIHVVAKSGTSFSLPSSTVSYVISSVDYDELYSSILEIIDAAYEPGMTQADFTEDWEYEDYLRMTELANAYSQTAIQINMTQEEAVDLFEQVQGMPNRMEAVESSSDLTAVVDDFLDFDMPTADMAEMIYELGMVAIQISIDEQEDSIVQYEELLTEAQTAINQFVLSAAAQAALTGLSAYASPAEQTQLNYFFSGAYEETYMFDWKMYNIASTILYTYEYHNPDDFLQSDNEYEVLFYNLMVEAYLADNTALLESFIIGDPLQSLYNLSDLHMNLVYHQENIDYAEDSILKLTELYAFFTLEKTMVLSSIQDVLDYVLLVYDTIPATSFTLLDNLSVNGELTMPEYFVLKNELINVLQTTLPSVEDFDNMYTMVLHIAGIMGDVDLTELMTYTDFFAEVQHASLDLALTFAADLDQATVEDIMDITDGMVIPGEMVWDQMWEEYKYTGDTYDFAKVVELAVYIGNYLEDFKTANAVKVEALETLLGDAAVEELIGMLAENIKDVMEAEMSPEEFDMASMIIDELVADYDNIVAGLQVFGDLGTSLITQFLADEGQLFLSFYDLVMGSEGDLADPLFVADLEATFALFVEYNDLFMANLDAAGVETILRAIRVPMKFAVTSNTDVMTYAEFDTLFNLLVGDVATVISNIITIEKQMVIALDGLDLADINSDITTSAISSGVTIMNEHRLSVILVLALDDLLTVAIEDLFFDTLDIISEDIMKNATILDLTGMTILDIDDMFGMLSDHYTTLFADVHTVAAYQISTLTGQQLDEMMAILQGMVPMGPGEPAVVN